MIFKDPSNLNYSKIPLYAQWIGYRYCMAKLHMQGQLFCNILNETTFQAYFTLKDYRQEITKKPEKISASAESPSQIEINVI